MTLSTEMNNRIVDLERISDGKIFPAEVRQVPSRFTENIANESIMIGYIDAEDSFKQKSVELEWNADTGNQWDWSNNEFKCTYTLPEPATVVAEQSPRGVSPISQRNHNMTVAE